MLGGVACPLLGAVHATSSNPAALERSEVRIHERTPVGRRRRQKTVHTRCGGDEVFNWAQTRAMRPSTLLMASAGGERHRLQDPARALRLAIRNYDEPKVARLTDWLLNGVPLQWDEQFPLARCRVIRGRVAPGDDGFAFALDKATGVVTEVRRPDEVSQMSKGDRVVTVDGVPLGAVPLGEAVEPESVVQVGLWRGGEMAALRRRLAQRSLDDGVVEVAKLACMGEPDPHPAPKPEPKPKP